MRPASHKSRLFDRVVSTAQRVASRAGHTPSRRLCAGQTSDSGSPAETPEQCCWAVRERESPLRPAAV